MDSMEKVVVGKYRSLYQTAPLVVRSPGRINLIGEHTDYNDGFVMPAAIHYDTVFAIAEAPGQRSEIYSLDYNETITIDINNPEKLDQPKWANYLLGVLKQFVLGGYRIKPFTCAFGGNIPMGAGLSSSASMECGFAFAINELFGFDVPREKLILMAQWAEHNYVGVKCGIMDQFASMMGKKDHVILLDCRSMEFEYCPLKLSDHTLILCDTRVKHSLVDSEYNTRRSECEQGVSILKKYYPHINSLRDADESMVRRHRAEMPGKVFDRCLYVVQEIFRVQEASHDLKANRLDAFGKKMFETHDGLSRLYEVSCKELDFLVEQAREFGTVVGSRMMGGGFGGCTINIVPKSDAQRFVDGVALAFRETFGHEMAVYNVSIKDGTNNIGESVESITLP
jgi:galactokinase